MVKYYFCDDPKPAAEYIAARISKMLAGGKTVLWLVAGGSALEVAVLAAIRLSRSNNLDQLTVSLTDERYGPAGHADSNWQQLMDKGFELPGARLIPVLRGDSLEQTVSHYAKMLAEELDRSDFTLALAGMGSDGHVFGIKPHSPAVTSPEDVIGYEWEDYTRITPTIGLIKKLDEVVLYAVGKQKHAQFDKLKTDVPASEQPAQLLKKLGQVTIFNDYEGDKL